jgi:hypothetical protein
MRVSSTGGMPWGYACGSKRDKQVHESEKAPLSTNSAPKELPCWETRKLSWPPACIHPISECRITREHGYNACVAQAPLCHLSRSLRVPDVTTGSVFHLLNLVRLLLCFWSGIASYNLSEDQVSGCLVTQTRQYHLPCRYHQAMAAPAPAINTPATNTQNKTSASQTQAKHFQILGGLLKRQTWTKKRAPGTYIRQLHWKDAAKAFAIRLPTLALLTMCVLQHPSPCNAD